MRFPVSRKQAGLFSAFATALFFSVVTVSAAQPAPPAGPNDAIYTYKGADRNQKLIEAAKKEGTLNLYTSLSGGESGPVIAAFEKKYGIKVVLWRARGLQVAQRVIAEGQGGRHIFDVVEINASQVEQVAREKLLSEFYSPHFADLPTDAIPAHRLWVSDRSNFLVVAYNTNKIKRADLPKDYTGFLDPKWKGQFAIEATDIEWMATIIKKMGVEKGTKFFRDLAATQPQMRHGHILLAQMVGAGEVPIALTIYNGEVESLKRKGTPIEWIAVDPVVGRPVGMGLAKNAPHPNAALLFADYMLSPETQQLFSDLGRTPVSKKVKTELNNFPSVNSEPTVVLDEFEHWSKLWNELFMKNKN